MPDHPGKYAIASYILTALALLLVLYKGLLAALFGGLLVYSLVHMMTPLLTRKVSGRNARFVAVAALGICIIAMLTVAVWGTVVFFRSDVGNIQALLQRLADIIEVSRGQFPVWLKDRLPADVDALREMLTNWLREHAAEAKLIGAEAGRTAVHLLIGMIVGAMIALSDTASQAPYRVFSGALRDRAAKLSGAFQSVVFAQVRISAINTAITAVYIFVILPLAGISLPLSKSLIAITFLAGLLPVVGNLISNTVLVIVSLSHSLNTAIASLLFMVAIHKLEYFLNARIIGSHINARAWELLVAMLVMESVFGLAGVIAAPVFYALLKMELTDLKLV